MYLNPFTSISQRFFQQFGPSFHIISRFQLFAMEGIGFRGSGKDSNQSAFSCSKLTIEAIGQGVKYVQS